MGSDIAINVEVTISDELRRLLAESWGEAPEPEPIITPDPPIDAPSIAADWQDILLRRDGQRPLAIRGLAIMTRRSLIEDPYGAAEQSLSLYLTEDRSVVAALAFEPAQTAPARPAHRCQTIRDQGDLEVFLKEWAPELCFEAPRDQTHHQYPAAGLLAVRSAFNSMAADCLSKGMLPA
jgi:hypothetical protein